MSIFTGGFVSDCRDSPAIVVIHSNIHISEMQRIAESFGEWVKERYEKGLEKGKTRAENIKRIAKKFIEDTKVIGKDMAEEARDFFRQYKDDLGKLYDDVVEKVRQIVKS